MGTLEERPDSAVEQMSEQPAATPAAAEHAAATGVDLTQVEGTGKDGVITKADVAEAASSAEPQKPEAPKPAGSAVEQHP